MAAVMVGCLGSAAALGLLFAALWILNWSVAAFGGGCVAVFFLWLMLAISIGMSHATAWGKEFQR